MGGPIVSGFTPGGGGAGALPEMPLAAYHRGSLAFIWDDFTGAGPTSEFGATWDHSGTVGSRRAIGGWADIGQNAATSQLFNDVAALGNNGPGENFSLEFRMDMDANPTTSSMLEVYFANDRIGFWINNAGVIFARTYVGGAQRVNIDSGHVVTPGVPILLRLEVTDVNVRWYVNNILVHTNANPGPDFGLQEWVVRMENICAGVTHLYVDWVFATQRFALLRI